MKRKLLFAVLSALAVLGSCKRQDDQFTFSVIAGNVNEGETVPVSVSILSGPTDGYAMSCSIRSWDSSTNTGTPVSATLLSGDTPVGTSPVSFTDSGHRDFRIKDLAPGTYMISVTLTRGGFSSEQSCTAVVFPNGKPPVPTEKKVTNISIPGASDGFTVETDGGFTYIVLDLKDYGNGKAVTYRCSVSPADADDPTLLAQSDNPGVASVSVSDRTRLSIVPHAVGKAVITVRSADGGTTRSFGVKVVDSTTPPEPVRPTDFTVPTPDSVYGSVPVTCGGKLEFTPTVTPANAEAVFSASSSDPSVATAEVNGGTITVKGVYPGRASITVAAEGGPSKTFAVIVRKDVKVTVEWQELQASDAQLKTKTFPCKLKFSSDSDIEFPTPIVWTVAMKAVVTVAGKDTQSVTDSRDVRFNGKTPAYYDVTTNILIPAWRIYSVNDFGLSVTLSIQRNVALDPDLWNVTFVETYKTQNAHIMDYLTEIQQ